MNHPSAAAPRSRPRWPPWLLLLPIFLASRLAAYLAGLRFHADLGRSWQVLDVPLLRNHLAQSLWYQHSQPPLYNLLLGLLLKTGAQPDGPLFQALWSLLGLSLGLATYALLRAMRVVWRVSLLVAALLLISPSSLIYEHWLFYDLPVALCAVLVPLTLWRALGSGLRRDFALFGASLVVLCLTRSLFHLAWLLGLSVLLLVPRLPHRRRLAWTLLVAVALTSSVYLKNDFVFGKFAVSTWPGMNLARLTARGVPLAERQALAATGQISAVSVVGPFRPLADYPKELATPGRFADIPALAQPQKQDGRPNFNHIAYIGIADAMAQDALVLLRLHPQVYALAHATAWLHYFRPASSYVELAPQRAVLGPYLTWWNRLVLGECQDVFVFLLLGVVLALLAGVRLARAKGGLEPRERAVAWLMLATVLWVTLVGNLLETGENFRFRATIDPFLLVWLGMTWTARPKLRSRRGLRLRRFLCQIARQG